MKITISKVEKGIGITVNPEVDGYPPSTKCFLVEDGNVDLSINLPFRATWENGSLRLSGNLYNCIPMDECLTVDSSDSPYMSVDDDSSASVGDCSVDSSIDSDTSKNVNVTVNRSINFKGCRFFNCDVGFNGFSDTGESHG